MSLTTGSTVYEKCSTSTAREKKKRKRATRCDLRKDCQRLETDKEMF